MADKTGSRTMTTYIAGPMTGLPEFNHSAFAAAAATLRAQGRTVLTPHEIDGSSTDRPWGWYMREALKLLLASDEVVLLPGWRQSRGARIEVYLAGTLDMPITEWSAVDA